MYVFTGVLFLWQISSAEFALVQAVQENANLRSKIVQSPDKLQVLVMLIFEEYCVVKPGPWLICIYCRKEVDYYSTG